MKNSKRLLLSIITAILMITLLFTGEVYGKSYTMKEVDDFKNNGAVGDIIVLKGSDLLNAEDAYCFEHKSTFRGGDYQAWDIVVINGKTAKNLATGKVVTNDETMVMNYILLKEDYERKEYVNGKNGHMSVRNIAIWAYQNTWVNSLGTDFFSKNWKHKYSRYNMSQFNFGNQPKERIKQAEQLIKNAEAYAKNHKGSANIEITGNKQVIEFEKNTYGPFKIKYSGDGISLEAKDLNGKNIDSKKIKVYSDEQCKNEIQPSKIKSNTNFYIKISDGTKIKNLKCKVSSSNLNAKIIFTARKDFWNNYGQGIMFVKPEENKEEKSVEFEIKNLQKISINGYVWIDVERTKANSYNSLYDEDVDENGKKEERVKGVTVNLKNKATGKTIATTTTNDNGEYVFDKPFYDDELKNHYVEFNYNGVKVGNKDISKYIPVAFNSTNVNEIKNNGSRALMNDVATKDVELSGIATTYKGTEKESTYGLGHGGNLFSKLSKIEGDTETLNYINLGLKEIPEVPFEVYENLANVKIGIKGYNYTYIYGQEGDRNKVAAPTVRWQNQDAYTRKIYPSDILYESTKADEMLSVNVTYNIDITNTTNLQIEELYKEQQLFIKNLTNTYDAKRYTLNDSNWEAPTKTDGETATATYKGNKLTNGIAPNNSSPTVQITFSVNRNALLEILKNPTGIGESYPTKATAIGYHEYKRKDYSWQNDLTKEQTHYTKDYKDEADAPYLVFQLGEDRTVSGKVFEDKAINAANGQKLGDGKYNEGEYIVNNVKVELLDSIVDENGKETVKLSHLYGLNSEGTEFTSDAEVLTGKDGNYTLKGLVPGRYYIRFTYGDGTQKIYDLAGNEKATLLANNYKSTIVTDEEAKKALKGGTDLEWYKKLKSSDASVAIDSMDTRIAVNEGKRQDILAGTAKLSISIENTPTNVQNLVVTDGGQKVVASTNNFNGLNLGVIEQPIQRAELEKIITNMKLIDSQNQPIFNGNPETAEMVGVSDLDGKTNGGSTYVRVERDESTLYGSTVELTYKIKVTNTSDVNYYNYDYYRYGEVNENKEVTLNVKEVLDYLDETLTFKPELSDSKIQVVTSAEGNTVDNTLSLGIGGVLYTANNKTRTANEKTSEEITLVAQRILSNQDDDMEVINEVEAKAESLDNSTDARDNSADKETEIKTIRKITESYKAKATATITPPTGSDRQTLIIYVIAGIIALAVLSTGVVFIKKFVKK